MSAKRDREKCCQQTLLVCHQQNTDQSPPLSGLAYINCSLSSTSQPEAHGVGYHTIKAENNKPIGVILDCTETSPPVCLLN